METTFAMPVLTAKEELIGLFSDTYKEANGIRPRWIDFSDWSIDDLKKGIDENCEDARREAERERMIAEQDVAKFKSLIKKTIEMGASDEATALRWIVDAEGMALQSRLDVEHFLYMQGILYTDYGQELYKKLNTPEFLG